MSNTSVKSRASQDTTKNPSEIPAIPIKRGNEMIRNREVNNHEHETVKNQRINSELKAKTTTEQSENSEVQINEKSTLKADEKKLEQIICQPKAEADHTNISANPIIIHNHIHNEYPRQNRERHNDISPTENNEYKYRNSFLGHGRASTNLDILAKLLTGPVIYHQLN